METVMLEMKHLTWELTNHATGWRQRRAGTGQGKAKHSNGIKWRGRMRLIIQGQGPQTEIAIRIRMRGRQHGVRLGVEIGGKSNRGEGWYPLWRGWQAEGEATPQQWVEGGCNETGHGRAEGREKKKGGPG